MATYREAYIIRIASDPVALFWSGHGDLLVPADIVIGEEDAIALGAGALVNIPDFQQLINGIAERLEFTLSGVSEKALRLALEDAPSVEGARVDIGRMDQGPDWQQIAPVEWEATFEARSLNVRSQGTGDKRQRSISLVVAAGDTTRSRSPFAFFTDADQRRRPGSEDDAIFDHVAGINSGTSRRWGPAT